MLKAFVDSFRLFRETRLLVKSVRAHNRSNPTNRIVNAHHPDPANVELIRRDGSILNTKHGLIVQD